MRSLTMCGRRWLAITLAVIWAGACVSAQEAPAVPHVDSVEMAAKQPQESAKETIWYDDFDAKEWKGYPEKSGELTSREKFGGKGQSLESFFPKGKPEGGTAGCKVWFGDCPVSYGAVASKIVRKGEKFEELYVRTYVKHQRGWEGGYPAKLLRATSLVNNDWAQMMIAHTWGGKGDALTLDPVRCVENGKIVSKKYNDWNGMKWLGNSPSGNFPLAVSDWWVAVEMRVKLNTPGQKDGENQLWVDGKLDAERMNLDFRGTCTAFGINSVMLESYWNKGASKDLHRWFDNFVISTKPIGPVVCPCNPTLFKTPYEGPGRQSAWSAELAADAEGKAVVFTSKEVVDGDTMVISNATGEFKGELSGKDKLVSGKTYFCRVRQKGDGGTWSDWSSWHQPFVVE
jgi:hypothetical protein